MNNSGAASQRYYNIAAKRRTLIIHYSIFFILYSLSSDNAKGK